MLSYEETISGRRTNEARTPSTTTNGINRAESAAYSGGRVVWLFDRQRICHQRNACGSAAPSGSATRDGLATVYHAGRLGCAGTDADWRHYLVVYRDLARTALRCGSGRLCGDGECLGLSVHDPRTQ